MTGMIHPAELWDAWLSPSGNTSLPDADREAYLLFRKYWDRVRTLNPEAVDHLRAYLEECALAAWSLPQDDRHRAETWEEAPKGVRYLINLRKSNLEPGDLLREDVLWGLVSGAVPLQELPFAWDVAQWAVWLLSIPVEWRTGYLSRTGNFPRAELTSWDELASEAWGAVRSLAAQGRWASARRASEEMFPSLRSGKFTGVTLRSARFWADELWPYLQDLLAEAPVPETGGGPLTPDWYEQAAVVRAAWRDHGQAWCRSTSAGWVRAGYVMCLSVIPGWEVPALTLHDQLHVARLRGLPHEGWATFPALLFPDSEPGPGEEALLLFPPDPLDSAPLGPDTCRFIQEELSAISIASDELPRHPRVAEAAADIMTAAGLHDLAAAVLRRFG